MKISFKNLFFAVLLAFSGLFTAHAQERDSLLQQALAASNLREQLYDYPGAIEELNLPELDNQFFVKLRMAELYAYTGKYTEALQAYQKALLMERSSVQALEGMMNLHYGSMDYPHAKLMAKKILALSPYHKNATLIAAKLLMANLDFLGAKMILEKYLQAWPTDYLANLNKAYCCIGMHDKPQAEKILLLLQSLYPGAADLSALDAALHS